MRTLLIDNYDSFTYNLYQYLSLINGEKPILIRNDQMSWEEACAIGFDNIVISPGPGHPERHLDFGMSEQAIRHFNGPILGVCLGHQGLASVYGASVIPAKTPMHGRVSEIVHYGDPLFTDVPKVFQAVRYHSLIVQDKLPESLQVVARSADGSIMAIKHSELPKWGIQFHPESILTEFGYKILENFKELSQSSLEKTGGASIDRAVGLNTSKAHREQPEEPIAQEEKKFFLHFTKTKASIDCETLFSNVFKDSPKSFWLDSSLVRESYSRFSFMGDNQGPFARSVRYDLNESTLVLESKAKTESLKTNFWQALEKLQREYKVQVTEELPFDFYGGLVGYFGYEIGEESVLGLRRRKDYDKLTPASEWLLVDRYLAIDHLKDEIYIIQLVPIGEMPDRAWEDQILKVLTKPVYKRESASSLEPDKKLSLRIRHPRSKMVDQIRLCQKYIQEGESYELCLTNQISGNYSSSPLDIYSSLRELNPAPYGAYMDFGDYQILSSSPERFLKIDHSREMIAKPIKGTAPRASSIEVDYELKRKLQESEKDRAENLMIVDLLRNDLGSVSEVGSVAVDKLMDIESYATVHQMVSTIRGKLDSQLSPMDAIRALFPGGSMTGAPKRRTIELLREIEEKPRGVYSGALGFLSFSGAIDLSIVIRTLICRRGTFTLGSGGAITALSQTEDEIDEMLLKASAPIKAIARAEGRDEQFHFENWHD